MRNKVILFCAWIMILPVLVSAASIPTPQIPAPKKHVLDIKHWKMKNGARVYFVSAPEIPMIDINVVFAAGSARDGSKFGLANFTNSMLDQGADDLTADDIAAGFENLGAIFSSSVGRDKAIVHLRSLTEKTQFNPALSLFNRVLTRPNFPQPAFLREQKSILQALKEQQQRPGTLASNAMYSGLYGKLPYSHPVLGTTDNVSKLNRYQLQKFYRRFYVAHNAVITIVGAVDEAQAKKIASRVTRGLRRGREAQNLKSIKKSKKQRLIHVFYPSKQTHIRVAEIGVKRKDPDYLALYVGNNILGGDPMTSRLFTNVREKRGFSYSIYSYFRPLATNGPFVIGLQTKLDQTTPALSVVTDTLARFLEEGPSEQELEFSKNNLINGLPLRLASNANISQQLVKIGFYKKRVYYLDHWTERVGALTTVAIRDAFQRKLEMNRLLIVTVGAEPQEDLNKIMKATS